jgi:hypothetical protein
LTDSEWNQIGTCNSKTCNIQINDEYQDQYDLEVDFDENGNPEVKVINKNSGNCDFTLGIKSKWLCGGWSAWWGWGDQWSTGTAESLDQVEGIELVSPGYQEVFLNSQAMDDFRGGTCIRPIGDECHIFISQQWDINIPPPFNNQYKGEYRYDDLWYIEYTINNLVGNTVVIVRFIPEPFQ